MPRTNTTPTIPTDQDALQAREASRAIESLHVDTGQGFMGQVLLRLGKSGEEGTSVAL